MRRAMYLAPVLALGLALACVAPALHGQDSRAEIQKRLAAEFKRTKMTADRSDIATAGSVLDLHKDGLVMCSTEAIASPTNTYKNGAISFGFGANMAWGMALAPANQQTTAIPQRKFVTGEKFWVTDYIVKLDGVVFQFYSDPYNDVRYYGQLKFPFTKNVAPPADEVMKAIEEVITAEADTQEAAPARKMSLLRRSEPPRNRPRLRRPSLWAKPQVRSSKSSASRKRSSTSAPSKCTSTPT